MDGRPVIWRWRWHQTRRLLRRIGMGRMADGLSIDTSLDSSGTSRSTSIAWHYFLYPSHPAAFPEQPNLMQLLRLHRLLQTDIQHGNGSALLWVFSGRPYCAQSNPIDGIGLRLLGVGLVGQTEMPRLCLYRMFAMDDNDRITGKAECYTLATLNIRSIMGWFRLRL